MAGSNPGATSLKGQTASEEREPDLTSRGWLTPAGIQLMLMEPNRRVFLQGLAAAPLFLPGAARGANDRPTFGIIGVGNRGQWLHQTFQKLGAQCVAVCDVYAPTLDRARSESPKDAMG